MIKMIAIDLDGTLLDDQKQFDQEKFSYLASKLMNQGVRVIIATGNQFIKSIQYFDGISEKLIYITDNGSTIHFGTQTYFSQTLASKDYQAFVSQLSLESQRNIVVSTETGAFILKNPTEDFLSSLEHHYPRIDEVEHFSHVDESVVKLTLKLDDNYNEDLKPIHSALPKNWRVTQSGFGYFDIIQKGVSKLTGIQELQRLWGIQKEEILAFGDSNNDIELLNYVPHSFAMGNANDEVKKAANYVIGTNNENAVIQTLEKVFDLVSVS